MVCMAFRRVSSSKQAGQLQTSHDLKAKEDLCELPDLEKVGKTVRLRAQNVRQTCFTAPFSIGLSAAAIGLAAAAGGTSPNKMA